MKNAFYINVVNEHGATYGYGGPYVPINTRILVSGMEVFGFENLGKLFPNKEARFQFLVRMQKEKIGTYGSLTWSHETG